MDFKRVMRMSLRTSLLLSALFPIVFVGLMFLLLKLRLGTVVGTNGLDAGFVVLMLLVGGAMAVQIIMYSHDILAKMKVLNKWSYAVLKGNLDHKIGITGDDEVARLSKTLSKMLRELKEAYSALQKEMQTGDVKASQQRQGVAASQEAVRRLTDTLAQMKEKQDTLVQEERTAAMEQVVRGMAHDFSEVMVPILGTCDHLLEHPQELEKMEGALEHVRTIQESALRAKKLLKNLAGIFPAPQEIEKPAEASSAAKQAIKMAQPTWHEQPKAEGRPIAMKTDLQLVPPAAVDENDLRDAIVNLIVNAAEAMPTGGTITIKCWCDEGAVLVEVRDSGKGMTEEVRKRALEPFYSTKEGAGKGLGLSTVNAMVQRYKGRLDISTEKGMGTRVAMTFPLWVRKTAGLQEKQAETKLQENLRIIVVDDDWMSRKTVARALETQEHTTETAETGEEGLAKIIAGTFDVAVIDRAMPGMSGDDLAREIKKFNADIPVIMLTGFGDIMIQEGDLPEYVDTVLAKPITIDGLHRGLVDAFTPKPFKSASATSQMPKPLSASAKEGSGGGVTWLD